MDRYWLLTWTTYGTWVPGDARGCVTRVRDCAEPGEPRREHDVPGTPYIKGLPGLIRASRAAMKGEPVWLDRAQAEVAASDFGSTARFRGWALLAGSVMANHVHLVVAVPGDPDPSKLLQILKSYASRALNERWSHPAGGTWWTASGSRRKLPDEAAVAAAVRYVENQAHCLAKCVPVRPASGGRKSPESRADGD